MDTNRRRTYGDSEARATSRSWFFTINNPVEQLVPKNNHRIRYMKWQLEVGDSGTNHYQGVVIFSSPLRRAKASTYIRNAHLEIVRNKSAALNYVCKVDTREDGPWEYNASEFTTAQEMIEKNDIRIKKNKDIKTFI